MKPLKKMMERNAKTNQNLNNRNGSKAIAINRSSILLFFPLLVQAQNLSGPANFKIKNTIING